MSDGYSFHWRGVYWASLTTAGRPDEARHDAYFGLVGEDTHGHPWLKIPSTGAQVTGMQLKDRGTHVGAGAQTPQRSTQVLLRGRVEWDEQNRAAITEIADVFSGSAYSAQPVISRRVQSGRDPTRVDVPVPDTARWFEFEVAWLPSSGGAPGPTERVLPFGGASPCGMRFSITNWDPAAG